MTMCHVGALCHLPCHLLVGKRTINVLLHIPCVMTGPPLRLSGRSARLLSGLKRDERRCLRDCYGSNPFVVRAKRKVVERLEARRARLLAGLQRVSVLLRCCTGPNTESLWLLVRWQSALHYFCFNHGYLAHLRWLASTAAITSFMYVFDDLLLVCFHLCSFFPCSPALFCFYFFLLFSASVGQAIAMPKKLRRRTKDSRNRPEQAKPVVVTSSFKLPLGVDGHCYCWRVCFS